MNSLSSTARWAWLMVSVIALMASGLRGLAKEDPEILIVPGKSIGKTHLGTDGLKTLNNMPKPIASDPGMSQNRLVWISGKPPHQNTLFLHTTANGATDAKPSNGVTIDEIRVTSPEFHTADGLHCGEERSKISKALPQLHPLNDDPGSMILVDAAHGIAFEFAGNLKTDSACVAITVFYPKAVRVTKAEQVEELIKNHP